MCEGPDGEEIRGKNCTSPLLTKGEEGKKQRGGFDWGTHSGKDDVKGGLANKIQKGVVRVLGQSESKKKTRKTLRSG